jgi:hypothetical protein
MRLLTVSTLLLLSLVVSSACSTLARHHEHLASAVVPAADSDDPISGEWDVSFFVHGQATSATFTLKLDGTKITGTAYSEHTGPGTVRDGTWDQGKLTFTLDFKSHESIVVTGNLKDTKLVGEFRTEGFTSNWEAKKK